MLKIVIIAGVALILGGGLVYGAAYAIGERNTNARVASLTHTFPSNRNISSLRVDEMVARVNIRQSAGDEIKVEAVDVVEEYFKYDIADGTLRISYNPGFRSFGFINIPWLTNRRTPVINIYVPEGMVFENVDIAGGVGDYNIEYINADSFNLDGGVGRVTVENSWINRLEIDGGIGEYNINGDIGEMNISGGVGRIAVSGSVERDIRIDGGVGEIKLDLAGDINNYDVRSDSGIGAVRINGERANNFNNPGAPYRLSADGGIGSISIYIR